MGDGALCKDMEWLLYVIVFGAVQDPSSQHSLHLPTAKLVTVTPEDGMRRARRYPCVAFVALCACLLWRSPSACGFHFAAPRISSSGHERRATLPPRLALGRPHQARRRRLLSAGVISREGGVRRREWPLLAEHVDGDGHGPEQPEVGALVDARVEEERFNMLIPAAAVHGITAARQTRRSSTAASLRSYQ